MRGAIAGLALTCGLGIEIVAMDDVKVVWRWSNEDRERVSFIRDARFRAGRQWYELADFTQYERHFNGIH